MKIPTIKGVIRRRILLNYRVEPEVVQKVLPANFQAKLVDGYAIAGICLIRLEQIRPKGLPAMMGMSSENTAHRIAVEWDDNGVAKEGVFVPRRDTDSRLVSLAGGRIFPGVQSLSKFTVSDEDQKIAIRVEASDSETPLVDLTVSETNIFQAGSVFADLESSSEFFEVGCIGYSSRPNGCTMDGMLLDVPEWQVSALAVDSVRSSYFDDEGIFPGGSIEFDHALLMRDIDHEWHSEPAMKVE